MNWHIFLPTPKGLGKVTFLLFPIRRRQIILMRMKLSPWSCMSQEEETPTLPVTDTGLSCLSFPPSLNCSLEIGMCELSWFIPCWDHGECVPLHPRASVSLGQLEPGHPEGPTPALFVADPCGRTETILGAVCREMKPRSPPAAAAACSPSGCSFAKSSLVIYSRTC